MAVFGTCSPTVKSDIPHVVLTLGCHQGSGDVPPVRQHRTGPWHCYVKWGYKHAHSWFGVSVGHHDALVAAQHKDVWRAAADTVAQKEAQPWSIAHETLWFHWGSTCQATTALPDVRVRSGHSYTVCLHAD